MPMMKPTKVRGRPMGKGTTLNPNGRPKGIREMLRDRYGQTAEGLFDMLDAIATGSVSVQQEKAVSGGAEGVKIIELTVRPTIAERTTAIVELLGYAVGKPMQVNLNINEDVTPSQMSEDQLRERVEALLEAKTKVALPAALATVAVPKDGG